MMPTTAEPRMTRSMVSVAPRPGIRGAEELVVDGVGDEVVGAAAEDRRHGEVGEGEGEDDDAGADQARPRHRQDDVAQACGSQLAPSDSAARSISSGIAVSAGASISTAKGSMYWTSPKSTAG